MGQKRVHSNRVSLEVRNIGGISHTTVEFEQGVTILTGRNATNRSSLLQAIMAALGSEAASLKADADEGRVVLTIGDTTYTRVLRRKNGTVTTSGDPYLEDTLLADLFAFLLATNKPRQTVATGEDLRSIIIQPIDIDDIEEEINSLQTERDNIDSELSKISNIMQELPKLRDNKEQTESQIEDNKKELSNIEGKIDGIDTDIDAKKEKKDVYQQKLEELKDVRGELETVRHEIETHTTSLDALKKERKELETDQEKYDEVSEEKISEIADEIDQLRREKDAIVADIETIQTVIQFNEDLLNDDLEFFADLQTSTEDNNVTEQLLEDEDEVMCWTCGSEADTSQIESMVENIRELRREYTTQRNEIDEKIDELKQEQHKLQERRRQRNEIEDRLSTVADEIENRNDQIEALEERRGSLTDQVEALETEVEQLQTENNRDSELLDLHKEANKLEVEIDQLESDLENVEDEIARVEDRIADRDELQKERETLQSEIEDLRTHVERIEQDAVDQFNNHMDTILDLLDYENLERIWIERTEEEVREGRRVVTKGRFDLHIVRKTDDGTVYEDTVDHLSESEREVTGLIFALAGYLVHDVHEEVPFILLDSVEAIDPPRIAAVINYLREYASYLIVALLEEDAAAVDDDYQRIHGI